MLTIVALFISVLRLRTFGSENTFAPEILGILFVAKRVSFRALGKLARWTAVQVGAAVGLVQIAGLALSITLSIALSTVHALHHCRVGSG